jgi:tetratricopeptide (TPR) repeat protein
MDEEARRRLESLGYVASSSVDESIQFDQFDEKRLDPKELIEVYNSFQRLLRLVDSGKFGQAKKVCRNLLKDWPDMEQLYFFLGRIALSENDTHEMVKNFSRFLSYTESDSNDSDMRLRFEDTRAIAHTNLGAALAREGKPSQAIEHYKKALFYNPYSVKANHNLAGAYFMQGKLRDSVKYYAKTLELDPYMPEAHYNLGNVLFRQGKYGEAITHYNTALELRPDWPEARNNLQAAQVRKNQSGKGTSF